jgi:uncharacterized protein YgiM (DUF1202 family)
VSLETVAHKYRRYTVFYGATFYPPGKQPESEALEGAESAPKAEDTGGASKPPSDDDASGTATVTWDRAPVRKEPKTGDIITHAVKGTRVKVIGKRGDWYHVEVGSKTGWVYRGTLGL